MTAAALNKKLKSFQLTKELAAVVRETKGVMLELNRAQLRASRNRHGKRIRPAYKSRYYSKLKNLMNDLPGRGNPDLKYTGKFHASIDVKITTKTYSFFSKDSKAALIEAKYPDIYGLTAANRTKYSQTTVLPKLRQRLNNKLRS